MWAVAKMGLARRQLPDHLVNGICRRVEEVSDQLTEQSLSLVIWSLYKWEYTWDL